MSHEHENNIKCPYCDYEDKDSWEFDEDEGDVTCGSCEMDFTVNRFIEVTYSSYKKDCEDGEHDYHLDCAVCKSDVFDYKTEKRTPLLESEWTYFKVMSCSVCDDKEYIDITKEEYQQIKNQD
jgi:hypothetical protein